MDTSPQPRGYCISCGYPQQGLIPTEAGYRCPECGRPFNPADPKTFRESPHTHLTRWLAKPIEWPVVILSLLAAAGVMLVSRWKPSEVRRSERRSSIRRCSENYPRLCGVFPWIMFRSPSRLHASGKRPTAAPAPSPARWRPNCSAPRRTRRFRSSCPPDYRATPPARSGAPPERTS